MREFAALFAGGEFRVGPWAGYRDPVEGDASYADNAALKARTLRAQLAAAGIAGGVLADDSGLEVAALGGRPGVTTAYYGGAGASWSERRAQLIAEVDATGDPARACRFVCALHAIAADGTELATFATVNGTVARSERGADGFSFDPIFVYPPAGRTFAELSEAEKNAVSHRAVAVAALVAGLRAIQLRGEKMISAAGNAGNLA